MEAENIILLLGAQKTLDPKEQYFFDQQLLSVKNWNVVLEKALAHEITGALYKNILNTKNKNVVSSDILAKLKKEYILTFAKNTKTNHDFKGLMQQLTQREIDFIPLKGMVLKEEIYGDIGLRPIADIDLLIRQENIEKTKNLMLAEGWSVIHSKFRNNVHQQINEQISHHPYSMRKGSVSIELHVGIHKRNLNYQVNINDFWQRAQKSSFLGQESMSLNKTDLLLHLCLHTHGDLLANTIKFKSFVDIVESLKKIQNEIDVDLLWGNSKKYGCQTEVEQILLLCNIFLKAPLSSKLKMSLDKKELSEKYKNLCSNIFDKNGYARFYYFFRGHYGKWKAQKQVRGITDTVTYWTGFLFPSVQFVADRYYNRKMSKRHFNFYSFFGIIRE